MMKTQKLIVKINKYYLKQKLLNNIKMKKILAKRRKNKMKQR